MRGIICLSVFIASSIATYGQFGMTDAEEVFEKMHATRVKDEKDTTWVIGGTVILDFSNVMLRNWASGGFNSISGKGLLSLFTHYQKDKVVWDNSLELAYGVIKQFDSNPKDSIDDELVYKSDDRIDFSSKYGRKAFKKYYYSALLNFRSQFAPGYASPADFKTRTNKISDFLAPGYLIAALGLDYKRGNEKVPSNFSFFFSPITSKITFVMDETLSQKGAFGVEKGDSYRVEVGGYVKIAYNRKMYEYKDNKGKVRETMIFDTKIDMFSNYLNNPDRIDINWTSLISMRFLKYFTFTSGTHLIYDHDIKSKLIYTEDVNGKVVSVREAPGIQFKWVTGLGFTYQF